MEHVAEEQRLTQFTARESYDHLLENSNMPCLE
jgi:hypothetical protein